MEETAVLRCLGNRQSLSRRNKERILRSFESFDEASQRVDTRMEKENLGIVRKRQHCGNFENMTWDKEGLKNEINLYINEDRKVSNWTVFAKQFNITDKSGALAKNAGQIAKDYLYNEGFDLSLVNETRPRKIVRKSKKKLFNTEVNIKIVNFFYY